jgi:MFS family permease
VAAIVRHGWPAPSPEPLEGGGSWWDDVLTGFRVLVNISGAAGLALAYMALGIGVQLGETLQVFAYRHVFHLSAPEVGVVLSAAGGAAVAGSFSGTWLQNHLGRGAFIVGGIAVAGLGWIVTATASAWALVLVGGILVGAPEAPVAAATSTLLETLIPSAERGRTLGAFRWIAWALLPIAAVGGGLLASRIGARWELALSGTVMLSAAAFGVRFVLPHFPRTSTSRAAGSAGES